jgi:hypothetical protein
MAALDDPDSAVEQVVEATLHSEGGMLYVDGSAASVIIKYSTIDNNLAGKVSPDAVFP